MCKSQSKKLIFFYRPKNLFAKRITFESLQQVLNLFTSLNQFLLIRSEDVVNRLRRNNNTRVHISTCQFLFIWNASRCHLLLSKLKTHFHFILICLFKSIWRLVWKFVYADLIFSWQHKVRLKMTKSFKFVVIFGADLIFDGEFLQIHQNWTGFMIFLQIALVSNSILLIWSYFRGKMSLASLIAFLALSDLGWSVTTIVTYTNLIVNMFDYENTILCPIHRWPKILSQICWWIFINFESSN